MSEAQKRRGAWPPVGGRLWTEAEDEVIRSLRPAEAVKHLSGRTPWAVYSRRWELRQQDEGKEKGA
jgi:hypothetical protein